MLSGHGKRSTLGGELRIPNGIGAICYDELPGVGAKSRTVLKDSKAEDLLDDLLRRSTFRHNSILG